MLDRTIPSQESAEIAGSGTETRQCNGADGGRGRRRRSSKPTPRSLTFVRMTPDELWEFEAVELEGKR
jgi:hypothetical protein